MPHTSSKRGCILSRIDTSEIMKGYKISKFPRNATRTKAVELNRDLETLPTGSPDFPAKVHSAIRSYCKKHQIGQQFLLFTNLIELLKAINKTKHKI